MAIGNGHRPVSRHQLRNDIVTHGARPKESTLMTDEYIGYLPVTSIMKHQVNIHAEHKHADGKIDEIHAITIEGFWSLLKRAWYGTHHHYSKKYAPLYIAEACWKYYHRNSTEDLFELFMRKCFNR